jgi:hypothetical protein
MIEHLSSTTNQLPDHQVLFEVLTKKMKRTVNILKEKAPQVDDSRLNKTISIMVYSSSAVSAVGSFQTEIRQYFFEAAFWSIHRYFPHIAIAVGTSRDLKLLQELKLPIFKIYSLVDEMEKIQNPHLLPKQALLSLVNSLKSEKHFSGFEYVYYSEGDEVLHMRNEVENFNAIDNSFGNLIVVPHRMQVLNYS